MLYNRSQAKNSEAEERLCIEADAEEASICLQQQQQEVVEQLRI